MRRLLQPLGRLIHGVRASGLQGLFRVGQGRLEVADLARIELALVLVEGFLRRVDQPVQPVLRFDLLPAFLVLVGVGLRVLDHLVDLVLVQAGRGRDGDLLFLAGPQILGRDIQDAVGVDVEGHLDLRDAARRRRNPYQVEDADRLVVPRHLALPLEHTDLDGSLVVRGGRKDLALLGWDRRVALDQARRDAAKCLDAERERRDVEKEKVLDVSGEHASLDRRADRDDLVRIDSLVRILAEELLDELLDAGHPGLAADQHDLIDVLGLDAGILQGLLARPDGAVDDLLD